ncbi:DUF4382 domain-containing protein [Cecembia rubra]|uniref:DUF4382 domain-containing protein n=1 Tax=Cecembia rubra TaxID=1485585 RepID=UPI001FE6A550|nr:DUF4382 domain-containing protein [Cecembia rubra]
MKKTSFILFVFLFSLFSCSNEDLDRSNGLVNVFIIGSPGEFEEIWLEIIGAEVKTTGGRGTDNTDPVFLPNTQTEKKVNIAGLTASSQFLIGRAEFSEGNIIEIKLLLGEDNFVVFGGQNFPLILNSEEAMKPKLLVNYTIRGGISHDIFLDFDAFRSFQISNGLEPRISLTPEIRSFLSLNTGRASGSISPANQRVAIITADENDLILSTTSSQAPSGNFSLRGLEAGKLYKTYIIPFNQAYLPDTLDSVRVNAIQNKQLGTINLRLRD